MDVLWLVIQFGTKWG